MAETYSLGATGQRTDSLFAVVDIDIGDSAGLVGSQQKAMAQNTQILCKNPDGSKSWYTLDAERSTAANVVLKAV